MLKRIAQRLLVPGLYVFFLVEVSLLLLRHRRTLRAHSLVYPFWTWSFGHTIVGLEYASRLYFPHQIALVYIPHPRSNSLLPRCFAHNVTVIEYRSRLPLFPTQLEAIKFHVLRLCLLVLAGLTRRFHVVDHELSVYKTLSLTEDRLLQGNNENGSLGKHVDWTGLIRLQHDRIGRPLQLPAELEAHCRRAIAQDYPEFFAKPFVTLLLRHKDNGIFDDSYRSSGSMANYRPAVEYLLAEGYHVVASGETEAAAFADLSGFYDLAKVADSSYELMNLFLLMHCSLFIGQQSGAFQVPNALGIPCVISDAVPYRLGTNNADDLILFKHLVHQVTGRRLSYVEVFRDHQDLAYGYHFQKKGMAVEPNSPDEILEAVREAVATVRGTFVPSADDLLLIKAFRDLPTKEMALHVHRNRPPVTMLRRLAPELIGG